MPERMVRAAPSFDRWHTFHARRASRERERFRQELARRHHDAKLRAQLQRALVKNANEQREFDRRWENSSFRRYLDSKKDKQGARPQTGDMERRDLSGGLQQSIPEFSVANTNNSGSAIKIGGLAAVYNRKSQEMGHFVKIIEPHAFDQVDTDTPDVVCLLNHDMNLVLGRTRSGTLRLNSVRSQGLSLGCDLLPDDPLSQAVAARIERGDIAGCSFSFRVAEDSWDLAKDRGQIDVRRIKRVSALFDVGPVTFPAYLQTMCQVYRGKSEAIGDDMDEFDRWYDEAIQEEMAQEYQNRQIHIENCYDRACAVINRNEKKRYYG